MNTIYRITTAEAASKALESGEFRSDDLQNEGFIHCSLLRQVLTIANLKFRGCSGLVLLEIDSKRITDAVRYENLEGGEDLYPHVYGPIPRAAISRILPFPCGEDGGFEFPGGE